MRFLVDLMCGGIVSYLRMCGHDTVYAGDRDLEADAELRRVARSEDRLLVTRDVSLADRTNDAILLSSRDVSEQLAELAECGVELTLPTEPTRCGNCNGHLERVPESTPRGDRENVPDPALTPVWACLDCGQWFWKGSHWDDVASTLAGIPDDERLS